MGSGNNGNIDLLFRITIYMIGFGLSVSGGVSLIAYLNLLTAGYEYNEYFRFVLTRPECYLFPLGIGLITFALFNRGFTNQKE